ncbi:hypothetical protein J6590_068960 [Homalodisca vitripennis]|nr:hypothetical protein J6590_058443 [Homalodisca vitripennis]KAG8291114.1 hypothetical protein J6590_068960 [Homalodisca vitripennis]
MRGSKNRALWNTPCYGFPFRYCFPFFDTLLSPSKIRFDPVNTPIGETILLQFDEEKGKAQRYVVSPNCVAGHPRKSSKHISLTHRCERKLATSSFLRSSLQLSKIIASCRYINRDINKVIIYNIEVKWNKWTDIGFSHTWVGSETAMMSSHVSVVAV